MNLKELKARGAFVDAQPVKKNVEWKTQATADNPEGELLNFDIYIKRLSFGTVEKVFLMDDSDKSRSANYIAQAVSFADEKTGKPIPISYEMAYDSEPSFARVLLDAINEVNGTGKTETKN